MSALENLFGPSSNLIQVSQFLEDAESSSSVSDPWFSDPQITPRIMGDGGQDLSVGEQQAIEEECRVDDLRSTLNNIISDPRLMSHVMKTHEANVYSMHETADTSNRRKRKRNNAPTPTDEHPDVVALKGQLDAVKLKSWTLDLNSALFIRPPKQPDHNTLINTKRLALSVSDTSQHQALIFVTIYNPVSWGHRLLARSSQHVLLSSQTLGDIYESIPCTSHEIPSIVTTEDGQTTWDANSSCETGGAAMCIEGMLYGDGQSEQDYTQKYARYAEDLPEKKRPQVTKATPMHETLLASMSLRLHTPYWLLHAGDCVHHLVFEQIRLLHPTDPPPSSYPLTTQITPPLLDLCRACSKVPAVLSIVGDIRLGESPYVICRPCWRWMGMPKGDDAKKIMVVPLPKYEFGWSG